MEQLFVTDLDGTLLDSHVSLTQYSTEKLNELIGKGIPITYATSRSYYTASKLLRDVGFQLPCITFNGVYVIHGGTGEIIRKNLLDPEVFDFILRTARELELLPYIFGKAAGTEKLLYFLPQNEAQARFLQERKNRNDNRLQENRGTVKLDEIITVTFLYPKDALEQLKERILQEYGAAVSVKLIRDIYSDGYYSLEIANKYANKGDMLVYVSDLLGVSMSEVTVFGDQANDEEMFRVAGTKVAVENAAAELKAMADVVIGNHNENAVVKYLLDKTAT